MKKFSSLDEFVAAQGSQLGPTEWLEVTQERVNLFADATDDHQWIHVDPERAADGPFGGPIAHGLLTLSLMPHFSHQLYTVHGIAMAINYGYNKVRFITPVKVGAKIRARAEISKVDEARWCRSGDRDDDDRDRRLGQARRGCGVDRPLHRLTIFRRVCGFIRNTPRLWINPHTDEILSVVVSTLRPWGSSIGRSGAQTCWRQGR